MSMEVLPVAAAWSKELPAALFTGRPCRLRLAVSFRAAASGGRHVAAGCLFRIHSSACSAVPLIEACHNCRGAASGDKLEQGNSGCSACTLV